LRKRRRKAAINWFEMAMDSPGQFGLALVSLTTLPRCDFHAYGKIFGRWWAEWGSTRVRVILHQRIPGCKGRVSYRHGGAGGTTQYGKHFNGSARAPNPKATLVGLRLTVAALMAVTQREPAQCVELMGQPSEGVRGS
jgi:hypothetical protein